ncbi:MAG TPA: metal-dependent hydrolase [Pseudonocardia sp.]|jgi:hypothetical protein
MTLSAESPQPVAVRPKRLRGADVGIPARQLDFRLSEQMPRWLFGDNITATTYLAVLSAFFPPGERFFIRSVNHFADQISDPTLRAQVAGFTGQEVIHGREHDRLNDVLRERGFNVDLAEGAVRVALALLSQLPARQQLACTALMEHFTALMAEETLAAEDAGEGHIHPDLNELWLWHALEELEHKSVSYEVYETAGNSWRQRLLAEPLVVATVGPALVISWAWLAVSEGALTRRGDVAEGLRMVLGPGAIMRKVLLGLPRFRRRDFHPAKRDTSALEQAWRERLFGAEGTLRDQLRRL